MNVLHMTDLDLAGKRVMIRFDFNVPLEDGKVTSDIRIQAALPTIRHALDAGCDILLVCNNPEGADEVLESLHGYSSPTSQMRMIRLHGQAKDTHLFETRDWQNACAQLDAFNHRLGLAESGDLFE